MDIEVISISTCTSIYTAAYVQRDLIILSLPFRSEIGYKVRLAAIDRVIFSVLLAIVP